MGVKLSALVKHPLLELLLQYSTIYDGNGWSSGAHTLCAEEFAGDVEGFAADNDYFLTIEQLFSHSTGEATQEMSLPIDHDLSKLTISCYPIDDTTELGCGRAFCTHHWIEGRHLGSKSLGYTMRLMQTVWRTWLVIVVGWGIVVDRRCCKGKRFKCGLLACGL